MIHIKPIPQNKASESIQHIYQDIQKTLDITFIPLMFQMIANYERYFAHLWEASKKNFLSQPFQSGATTLRTFANIAVQEIYTQSSLAQSFIERIKNPTDLYEIKKTVDTLERVNGQLMLLNFGLRESLRGIVMGYHLLKHENKTEQRQFETLYDLIITADENLQTTTQATTSLEGTRMSLTLFGTGSLTISHYNEFFSIVATEMNNLASTEEYLAMRVQIEQLGQQKLNAIPYPLGSSYAEIIELTRGQPYFPELLYLLCDTFPSTYPRLVFTSPVMKKILNGTVL